MILHQSQWLQAATEVLQLLVTDYTLIWWQVVLAFLVYLLFYCNQVAYSLIDLLQVTTSIKTTSRHPASFFRLLKGNNEKYGQVVPFRVATRFQVFNSVGKGSEAPLWYYLELSDSVALLLGDVHFATSWWQHSVVVIIGIAAWSSSIKLVNETTYSINKNKTWIAWAFLGGFPLPNYSTCWGQVRLVSFSDGQHPKTKQYFEHAQKYIVGCWLYN